MRADDGAGAPTARLPVLLSVPLGVLVWVFATGAGADDGFADRIEFFGRLSPETRLYPDTAAYPDQRSHASGLAAELTAYWEGDGGESVTVTPFFRYDAGDPDRTHVDLREAYLLLYGDVGDDEWELRLGVDRVFWGVVESRPLVDIVNQTDLVENPDEKTKMGQPMVHLTLSGDWGALELFGLTGHRERTLPGRRGRLRAGPVVDRDLTSYESAAEEWRLDFAARYTGTFGPFDVGLKRVRRHEPRAHACAGPGGLRTRPGALLRADHPVRAWIPSSPRTRGFSSWRPFTAPARKTAASTGTSLMRKRTTWLSSRAANTRSMPCGIRTPT